MKSCWSSKKFSPVVIWKTWKYRGCKFFLILSHHHFDEIGIIGAKIEAGSTCQRRGTFRKSSISYMEIMGVAYRGKPTFILCLTMLHHRSRSQVQLCAWSTLQTACHISSDTKVFDKSPASSSIRKDIIWDLQAGVVDDLYKDNQLAICHLVQATEKLLQLRYDSTFASRRAIWRRPSCWRKRRWALTWISTAPCKSQVRKAHRSGNWQHRRVLWKLLPRKGS